MFLIFLGLMLLVVFMIIKIINAPKHSTFNEHVVPATRYSKITTGSLFRRLNLEGLCPPSYQNTIFHGINFATYIEGNMSRVIINRNVIGLFHKVKIAATSFYKANKGNKGDHETINFVVLTNGMDHIEKIFCANGDSTKFVKIYDRNQSDEYYTDMYISRGHDAIALESGEHACKQIMILEPFSALGDSRFIKSRALPSFKGDFTTEDITNSFKNFQLIETINALYHTQSGTTIFGLNYGNIALVLETKDRLFFVNQDDFFMVSDEGKIQFFDAPEEVRIKALNVPIAFNKASEDIYYLYSKGKIYFFLSNILKWRCLDPEYGVLENGKIRRSNGAIISIKRFLQLI